MNGRIAVAALAVLAAAALAALPQGHAVATPRHRVAAAAAGCADGAREAFRDVARYPRIAGCSGAWALPGVADDAPTACDRKGGDDGAHRDGRDCRATDLCAAEWHVCRDAADVARSSPDGCGGAADAPARSFYATRQTGPGCAECATGTTPACGGNTCAADCAPSVLAVNDLFGCGTLGDVPHASCGVLDRFSNDVCGALGAPWRCAGNTTEARDVVKLAPSGGGVLCCRD